MKNNSSTDRPHPDTIADLESSKIVDVIKLESIWVFLIIHKNIFEIKQFHDLNY